jgi:hypothetical protein
MKEFSRTIAEDLPFSEQYISTSHPDFNETRSSRPSPAHPATQARMDLHFRKRTLLQLLMENEIGRFSVWSQVSSDPSYASTSKTGTSDSAWMQLVETAWAFSPGLAVELLVRFKHASVIGSHIDRLLRIGSNLDEAAQVPTLVPRLISMKCSKVC